MPYLIDGHNLIAAMPGMSLADLDDERTLMQRLDHYARHSRALITLYFDRGSLAAPQMKSSARVKIHFVRAPRTADDAIRAHLQRLGREAANWTVVSSDREVQAAARHAGARNLDSQAFAIQIATPGAGIDELDKPEPELGPEEIEAWEQLFRDQKRDRSS